MFSLLALRRPSVRHPAAGQRLGDQAVRKIRWGLLSTARVNDLILEACRGSELVDFVAVASRDSGRARAYADARALVHSFGDYDELLKSEVVDAVYIGLPNGWHVKWAMTAAEAGKHVLCEKPLSRDPEGVARAFDAAEMAEVVLAEALMYRYHPQTRLVRDLVNNGAIGELRHVNATLSFTMETDLAADPRGSAAMEGGALMDVGSYCVSGARLFLGEPQWVFGVGEELGEVDVRYVGMLGFPGGATASFDAAMSLPRRDGLELVGLEGSIWLDDPWHCRSRRIELRRPDVDGEIISVDDPSLRGDIYDAYRLELEEVSRAILAGEPLEFGRDDAVAQAATLRALENSWREHEVITLAAPFGLVDDIRAKVLPDALHDSLERTAGP